MIYIVLSALGFLAGAGGRAGFGAGFDVVRLLGVWPVVASVLILLYKNWEIGLVFVAFLCGIWRVDVFFEGRPMSWPQEKGEVSGAVVSQIDEVEAGRRFTLDTEWGKVLVTVGAYEKVEFGDEVRVFGVLEAPSTDINGFNYANYLAVSGIWLTLKADKVEVLRKAEFSVQGVLYDLKDAAISRLNSLYHEPEAGFAAGLILGSKRSMPEFLSSAFKQVGLSHIVVISGSNMSLVIYAISFLFMFLPFKKRIALSAAMVTIFVIFVGASAAVFRAGLMGVLGLMGLYMGRRSMAFFALMWSAVLMVLVSPLAFIWDSGFQLSFSSVLGLLCFGPVVSGWFGKFWPEGKVAIVREALVMTLSAQIATMPLVIFSFGGISTVAPLANVLAAPLVPFAMLFSALSIPFGEAPAAPAIFYLKTVEFIALKLSAVPYSFYECQISVVTFFVAEAGLILFTIIFYKPILARAFFRGGEAKISTALNLLMGRRVRQ
ncbi:MAG: ComEC/Rec2 family competence protein [Candidatus Gracilibacteria bacterium]|jgi:ComEC/Rec2-related protein